MISPDDPRLSEADVFQGLNMPGSIHDIQAHLILHFRLEFDPLRFRVSRKWASFERFFLETGLMDDKHARSARARQSLGKRLQWQNDIPQETPAYLYEHMNDATYKVSPRKGHRTLSSEQAERQWKRMLRSGD